MTKLHGKVVLVTGAARGIGEHTTRLAAARGARLALVGLEPERLAALAADLNQRHPAGHRWFEADVTDQPALDRAAAETVAAFGGIDVVVANAGIANLGTVAGGDLAALIRTVEVNLIGVMRTVSATIGPVITARGYLLLVSSAAAFTALPGMAAYCAAKAGVEQFGNVLRLETAHHGVRVGIAHPSWVDTDLVRDARSDLAVFQQTLGRVPGPLGATTTVERCAEMFVDAIERRRRRVYVPRSLAAVAALRTLTVGPLAEAALRRPSARLVPALEAQVRSLGRPFGRSSVESHPPQPTDWSDP